MDKNDLDNWCKKNNRQMIEFKEVIPAKLHNYKLTFNYYSRSRDGGAANIMPLKGSCVYGLLLKINKEGLKLIRRKEGHPKYYEEINIEVESLDGEKINNVKSYKVVKERELASFQAPTRSYMDLIINNARNYNFPIDYINFLKSFETK